MGTSAHVAHVRWGRRGGAAGRVEMKRTLAVDQVARAGEHDRVRRTSLAADLVSSILLFGLVIGVTAIVVLPIAFIVGVVL